MRFYVGTYSVPGSPGIALCGKSADGLTMLSGNDVLRNPTYLITDHARERLFAMGVAKSGEGVATCFAIRGDTLQLIATAPTGEDNACFLTLSQDEHTLYTANYHEGNLAVYRVSKEKPFLVRTQTVIHEGRGTLSDRQEGPHVHHCAFRPGTRELFVCDLGIDQIVIYSADPANGSLTKTDSIMTPAGTGPRHLVFLDQETFFVAGELSSTTLRYALRKGAWVQAGEQSTLPAGPRVENTCAAIRLKDERLYVSNRGADNLAIFDIAYGRLSPLGHIPCHGSSPRDFVVADDGFLCANQVSGTVTAIAQDGTLEDTLSLPGAVCICPV